MWKHPKDSSWSQVRKIQGIQRTPCGGNSWTKVCLKSFFVVVWFDQKQGHIFNFPSFGVSYMCVLLANHRNTRWCGFKQLLKFSPRKVGVSDFPHLTSGSTTNEDAPCWCHVRKNAPTRRRSPTPRRSQRRRPKNGRNVDSFVDSWWFRRTGRKITLML